MRLIDADVLLDNIRRDSKKAIDEGDNVGSFWLGYAAGFVIKQPTIQSALDPETLIRTIETGITATNSSDAYSLGMRNGMRWCKSLIDGAEPKFEYGATRVDDGTDSADLPPAQPEPQEGYWIRRGCGLDIECKCSVCGYKDFVEPHDTYWFKRNYCPNCGAKMKGDSK